MASTQALKSRIRSVKSTKQITKAMQLVAASKMRRAQDATKISAPYTLAARQILTNLSAQMETNDHPLYAVRPVKNRLFIVIAGDRGLAGAYNSNVFKRYIRERQADVKAGIGNHTIAVGRRTVQFVSRLKDTDILGVYEYLPDNAEGRELHAIIETARAQFEDGIVDAVDIVYTQFNSSLSQEVVVQRVLPAGYEKTDTSGGIRRDVLYEPNPEVVLDSITQRLVTAQMFQALLDARASEYSMRMLAMKNATDNATDLISDLTLAMNKARQGAITQELAEISGGVEALNN
ncbi:MAG TPA: ATP synthase F1 subunit gamma [Candidatus Saccharimonadales bacterium]|nr:ATP synthase F1 subunit gamma [Candidatus Saccharimonadales bacterium]